MNKPMMKCGHAANAVNTATGSPSCAICVGLTPDAEIVDDSPPDLSRRRARCHYHGVKTGDRNESNYDCKRFQVCECERPSSTNLPFFEAKPGAAYDSFYCGCFSWD